MDKTSVCGTDAPGSTPGESTHISGHTKLLVIAYIFLVLSLIVIGLYIRNQPESTDFKLTILHFNDLHSRLLPSTFTNGLDCTDSEDCVGGVARLKTLIAEERAKKENTLVLTSGDVFQGSVFFSMFRETFLAEVLHELGIDVMSVGNHEFDDGDAALARFIEQVNFPVLGGNVRFASTSPLSSKLLPYTITEFGSTKVGIISVVTKQTPELSSPASTTVFLDETEYLKSIATELHNSGIGIIIALTHVGYTEDIEIANNVPYIDVIVGGHSDSYLSNTDKDAVGSYPTIVTNKNKHKTAIVQTKPYGAHLGELNIVFNSEGEIRSYTGKPILVEKSISPNPALAQSISRVQNEISNVTSMTLGKTTRTIEGNADTCRKQECEIGNLATDALALHGKTVDAPIALLNSGSIRTSIKEGEIQKDDVISALPFGGTLVYGTLEGAQLLTMLEKSVGVAEEKSGAFLQVSGLSIYFDPTEEPGERICEVIVTSDNTPLQKDKTYTVITTNYLAGGGDGYAPLQKTKEASVDIYTALENYLSKIQYYEPKLNDRIVNHCR